MANLVIGLIKSGSTVIRKAIRKPQGETANVFEKALEEKLKKAPVIKVGLFKDSSAKAASISSVVTGKKRPKFPPSVDMILKSVKERFNLALNLIKHRNPNDFISKSEFDKELEKRITEAMKNGEFVKYPTLHLFDKPKDESRVITSTFIKAANEAEKLLI